MIKLFEHDKHLRSKITVKSYQRHGSDLLIFYALGGSNLQNLDFIRQTELYKNYESYLKRYDAENGKQIIELYQAMTDDPFEEEDDDVDETDPEGIFTEEGHYGDGLKYYNNPQQLIERLAKLHATFAAGNTASEVFNEANSIIKELMKIKHIGKEKYLELVKLFN